MIGDLIVSPPRVKQLVVQTVARMIKEGEPTKMILQIYDANGILLAEGRG